MRSTTNFMKLSRAINLQVKEPLDYRSIVDYKSDLIKLSLVPEGFVVTVLHDTNEPAANASSEAIAEANGAEAAVYFLKSAPSTNSANWEKLAVNGNQYSATGLQFKGSFADQDTALAHFATPGNTPDNGWYYYNQDTKQFMVHNGSAWTKLCDLADFGVTIANADSLSFNASYNGIKLPTKNTDTSDINNVVKLVVDEEPKGSGVYNLVGKSSDIEKLITDNSDPDNPDPVVGTQINLYFGYERNTTIKENGVDKNIKIDKVKVYDYEVKIDNWEIDSYVPVIFTANDCWIVLEDSYTKNQFDFSLDTFDWNVFVGKDDPKNHEQSEVSVTGFDEIYNQLKDISSNKKKKAKFLIYDGNRYAFSIKANETTYVISFLVDNYYVQVDFVAEADPMGNGGSEVRYLYSVEVKNIIADATSYTLSETDNNPIASKTVYEHLNPLKEALTWGTITA